MMHKTMYHVAFALLLVPAALGAQETVERSRPAAADGTVEIDNIAGSIRVEAWDRNEVSLVARLGRGVEGVEFEGSGSDTRIRVVYPRRGNSDGTELTVTVPAGSRVKVQGVSADVIVREVRGAVEAQSVSGDVSVTGPTRTVRAQSVSGDVDVRAATTDVRVQSVSGGVDVTGATGFIEAETTSGDVRVEGREASSVTLHSVSGTVAFRGSLHANGSVNIESFSGTVDFAVPAATQGNFEATTFSGHIDNRFNDERPHTERRGPGSELDFSTGSRGAQIELNSFSGTIRIRRL